MHDKDAMLGEDVPPQGVLCPGCRAEVSADEDFCPACGAALDMYSVVDPAGNIQSRGLTWWKSAWAQRAAPSVLIAMWLIFVPVAAILIITVAGGTFRAAPLVGLSATLVFLVILYRLTRAYIRHRRKVAQERPGEK